MSPGIKKSKTENSFYNGSGHSSRSGQDTTDIRIEGYEFLTAKVTDVIVDPDIFIEKKIEKVKNFEQKISEDSRHLIEERKVPRNSVICKILDSRSSSEINNDVICFPFFSSHMSMPIKVGEIIWVVHERDNINGSSYYWMSRKHGIEQVDDVNYTNLERTDVVETEIKSRLNAGTYQRLKSGEDPATVEKKLHVNPVPEEATGVTKKYFTSNLINNAVNFSDKFVFEAVPKISKLPGDMLLQGSNNAFLQLTTEKFKIVDEEEQESNASAVESSSPAIDLCIFRKKLELSEADNLSIENTDGKSELIKTTNIYKSYDVNVHYDLDALNCGGRFYLSNNCSIDEVFDISNYEDGEDKVFESHTGASAIIYSDHVRLKSNKTLRLSNNFAEGEGSYIEIDESGIISIGSKKGDKSSEGGEAGSSGMQPLVKGEELQLILERLIDEIKAINEMINDNFAKNATPGFGIANLVLSAIIPTVYNTVHSSKLDSIKNDLTKFKSTLIRGE